MTETKKLENILEKNKQYLIGVYKPLLKKPKNKELSIEGIRDLKIKELGALLRNSYMDFYNGEIAIEIDRYLFEKIKVFIENLCTTSGVRLYKEGSPSYRKYYLVILYDIVIYDILQLKNKILFQKNNILLYSNNWINNCRVFVSDNKVIGVTKTAGYNKEFDNRLYQVQKLPPAGIRF